MRFAKVVFWIAAGWGFLVLTPLFFIFDRIGRLDPPPISHPGFYYGFVSVALAWQLAFITIALEPVRLAPIIPAAMVEKFGYAIVVVVLVLQDRMRPPDLVFAAADLVLGCLFIVAFLRVRRVPKTDGT